MHARYMHTAGLSEVGTPLRLINFHAIVTLVIP